MNTSSEPHRWTKSQIMVLAAILSLQLTAAYFVGAYNLLTNVHLSPMPPIAITAVVPVALFLLTYTVSQRFRRFVLSQDIHMLTMLHLWRVIGFVFLALYAVGSLPGLFAWPAGVGDVAIGLFAVLIVKKLDRDPAYALSTGFRWFHILGLLDLIVAVFAAGLSGGAFPELIPGGITSALMEVWPMNVFPSFIVPFFIITHLVVFLNVREMRRKPENSDGAVLRAA